MFAWNGSSAFLSGTCKTLGCHLGPLEKLFPYKSMAVLGSQNGTIKRNNPTFLEKKKKVQPALSEGGVGAVHTYHCCRHPMRYFLLLHAVAGLCSALYFTGKNKSYFFTQRRASLEQTTREGKRYLNLNGINLLSQRPEKTTLKKINPKIIKKFVFVFFLSPSSFFLDIWDT